MGMKQDLDNWANHVDRYADTRDGDYDSWTRRFPRSLYNLPLHPYDHLHTLFITLGLIFFIAFYELIKSYSWLGFLLGLVSHWFVVWLRNFPSNRARQRIRTEVLDEARLLP